MKSDLLPKDQGTLSARLGAFLFLVILAMNILALSPLLRTGYLFDDAMNSNAPGVMKYTGESVGEFTLRIATQWIHNEGRFYPLSFYSYALFSAVQSLILYKILQLLSVVAAFLLFAVLVLRLTRDRALALLAFAMLGVVTQFRLYYDPILAFHLLLIVVFSLLMLSSLAFLRYLESGKLFPGIFGALLYLTACLTYEVAVAYCVFFMFLAYNYGRESKDWRAIFVAWPYVLIALTLVVVSTMLRSQVPTINETYRIHLDLRAYWATFWNSIVSCFPGTYYLFNLRSPDTGVGRAIFGPESGLFKVIAFVAGGGGIFLSLIHVSKIPRGLWLVAGLLLVLAFPIVSLSVKFQGLPLGVSYLPVFLGTAGAGLLLVCLMGWIVSILPRNYWRSIVAGFFSLVFVAGIVVTHYANNLVVEHFKDNLGPRQVLQVALKNQILEGFPDGARLIFLSHNPWDDEAFIILHSGKKVVPMYYGESKEFKDALLQLDPDEPVYAIGYQTTSDDSGYAYIGELLPRTPEAVSQLFGDARRLLVRNFKEIVVEHVLEGQSSSVTRSIQKSSFPASKTLVDILEVALRK